MKRGDARAYRAKIEKASAAITDDATALEATALFPNYKVNHSYGKGDRFKYLDKLYRVIQPHTSQAERNPAELPALYTLVGIEEWPEWVQPLGAEDAYGFGAKVTHNGKKWVSSAENNVWEPGVYGWDEYTDGTEG